jgi:hypothetical protein
MHACVHAHVCVRVRAFMRAHRISSSQFRRRCAVPTLVTCGNDGSICVIDLKTLSITHTLHHTNKVFVVRPRRGPVRCPRVALSGACGASRARCTAIESMAPAIACVACRAAFVPAPGNRTGSHDTALLPPCEPALAAPRRSLASFVRRRAVPDPLGRRMMAYL